MAELNRPLSDKFQSTHPKRDESYRHPFIFFFHLFQSTHPKRDETLGIKPQSLTSLIFQSTHPKRDETFA